MSSGVAVFNADDPGPRCGATRAAAWATMTFGFEQPADVSGRFYLHGLESRLSVCAPGGQFDVLLALPGQHNARNALAAATACLAAGVSLAACRLVWPAFGSQGAAAATAGPAGCVLLDDTYNANPDSVRAGIDVLAATIGKTVLVLGDMGEIGEMSAQFHDEIGGYAKSQGIDRLLALGEASALAALKLSAPVASTSRRSTSLINALSAELTPETTVLVKGSRFMRMERVADAISVSAPGRGA
jgi:UDP-N-acetylmuramoyl-tripeptide--D-alanyl-D-alanine ligase